MTSRRADDDDDCDALEWLTSLTHFQHFAAHYWAEAFKRVNESLAMLNSWNFLNARVIWVNDFPVGGETCKWVAREVERTFGIAMSRKNIFYYLITLWSFWPSQLRLIN